MRRKTHEARQENRNKKGDIKRRSKRGRKSQEEGRTHEAR